MAYSFIDLRKPLCHDKAVKHEGAEMMSAKDNSLVKIILIQKWNLRNIVVSETYVSLNQSLPLCSSASQVRKWR